ncbi:MAG: S41 family peptidase [Planctomycetes bacterium]|nr:S41 family peptidase [Planctomycetota bacterium]
MTARTLALFLVLPFVLPLTTLSAAPVLHQQGNLEALVAGEVDGASQKDVPALWQRALELRDAEKLASKEELDRALDSWLARAKELTPQAALLVSASRLLGSSPDVGKLVEALAPLVDAGDATLAAAASELLANRAFKTLAPTRRDEFANKMLKRAEDAALAPRLRLEFAKAAYRSGGGKERIKANTVLRSFLDSQDPELKAQGALSMAELDAVAIEGELRATLEKLKLVPDERGALAESYLQREDLRRANERTRGELLKRAEGSSTTPEMKEFLTVLRLIQERHLEGRQVKQEDLFEAAINGMLHYMDNHSNLLSSEQYARFYGELEAEYGGIGAYVNEDPDDGLFTIVKPIYSGPAYHTGLMTDDKIVRIGDWQTLGQPVDDIIKHLKGKPGTPVDLYVWRHGMEPGLIERPTEDMKVTVAREQVRIPPGTYQMLPGGVGLLQLDEFSQVAMEEARSWIEELKRLGMKSMILDLRFNGGGLLSGAVDVAELFLPRGKDVVSTEGPDRNHPEERRKETLRTRAKSPVLPESMPLVVLVGSSTASAAEIVSGALQDHGRAKLVGKTTYGKGSVQDLIQILPDTEDEWDDENQNRIRDPWEKITKDVDGDGEMDYAPRVKLTIAHYLLPSGRSIHRDIDREGHVISEGGVKPDMVVDAPAIEGWRIQEQRRIRKEVGKHVEATYAANRELYGRLAVNDQKRPELYPAFDELLGGLNTTLARDDVRRVLRYEVRRRVQDDRGAEFPAGDFVEDVQLQKAIEVALDGLGQKPTDVDDFNLVFDLPKPDPKGGIQLANRGSQELTRALSLLRGAQSGGKTLSREEMDQLIEILGTIDDRKN